MRDAGNVIKQISRLPEELDVVVQAHVHLRHPEPLQACPHWQPLRHPSRQACLVCLEFLDASLAVALSFTDKSGLARVAILDSPPLVSGVDVYDSMHLVQVPGWRLDLFCHDEFLVYRH